MDDDPVVVCPALAQGGREVAVQFDQVQVVGRRRQRFREGTESRADLDEGVAGARRNGAVDRIDDPGIDEKMLAEAFSRPMPAHRRVIASARS